MERDRLEVERLNESPSEKEGKFQTEVLASQMRASMKAPPKRKGNMHHTWCCMVHLPASMKAPPKRKGNLKSFGANFR